MALLPIMKPQRDQPGVLQRREGQLVQPTTPAGQKTIGATPQQAKMAGTPAQKAAVIQPAAPAAPPPTAEGPRQPAAPVQQQVSAAQEAATKIERLGSLSGRVQGLIEKQISSAATQAVTAGAVIDAAALDAMGLTPEARPAAEAALQKLAANPQDQTALVELSQALGRQATDADLQALLQTGTEAVGQAAAEAAADQLTLGSLGVDDYEALGIADPADLAATLGVAPEALAGMTMEDLQSAVDAQEKSLLNEADELRAALRSFPIGSAQYQQVQQRLEDILGAGYAGAEQTFEEAAEQIDLSGQVEIGGRTMSVEEALGDQQISDLIMQYLGTDDPEAQDQLLPPEQFADLRAWVEENQASLGTLADSMGATAEAFGEAQETVRGLGTFEGGDLDEDTITALIGELPEYVTADQAAKLKEQITGTGIGELLATDSSGLGELGLTEADTPDLAIAFAENVEQVKDLSADELATAYTAGQELEGNPILAALSGIDPEAFVTDSKSQSQVAKYKEIAGLIQGSTLETLADNPQFLQLIRDNKIHPKNFKDWAKFGPNVLGHSGIQKLISSGKLTDKNRDHLLDDIDNKLSKWDTTRRTKRAYSAAKDVGDVLELMFGAGTSAVEVEQNYKRTQKLADLGDKKAQKMVEQYRATLDLDGDGRINTATDLRLLKEAGAKKSPGLLDILGGAKVHKDTQESLIRSGVHEGMAASEDSAINTMARLASDNMITEPELQQLSDQELAAAFKNPKFDKYFNRVDMKQAIGSRKANDLINEVLGSGISANLSRVAKDPKLLQDGGKEYKKYQGILSQLKGLKQQSKKYSPAVAKEMNQHIDKLRISMQKSMRQTRENALKKLVDPKVWQRYKLGLVKVNDVTELIDRDFRSQKAKQFSEQYPEIK